MYVMKNCQNGQINRVYNSVHRDQSDKQTDRQTQLYNETQTGPLGRGNVLMVFAYSLDSKKSL